jgi:hypothetical protein
VPPPSLARLGVALWIRREVRSPPVLFGCTSALRVAGSPSPELNRRRRSPCAVVLRCRRPGGSPEVSPSARGRPGAIPASFGASLPLNRSAPPLAAVHRRASPRRRPPAAAAACAAPWPPDGHPTAPLAPCLPVKPGIPVYPTLSARLDPWPSDLDPADQIQPINLNRAVLLKSPLVFPVSQKYPPTLENPYD